MTDAPEDDHPQLGPASTARQFRLTAIERADLHRALMTRLTVLAAGGLDRLPGLPADAAAAVAPLGGPREAYRLRQMLDRFSD